MKNRTFRDVQYFFYSQSFADGLRAVVAILLPAIIGAQTGNFETGLAVSLGALCVSLTDAPGPFLNKRNGMLFCTLFVFVVAVLTGFANASPWLMGIEVAVVCFFFSMFVVYGARATGVGSAAILVMILMMDKPLPAANVLSHAIAILAGGLFYLVLSLLLHQLRPYRHAQRVLGECILEIANYLSIRADFYNTKTDHETDYKRLVTQQVIVNEKQDLVREVFFKTRQIVEESTDDSRKLVFAFIETVDLFEDITAAYYDYRSLRSVYSGTGALDHIHNSLKKVVAELQAVGLAILGNTSFEKSFDYDEEIKELKRKIDAIGTFEASHRLVLKKIIVNIRNLLSDLDKIEQYFTPGIKRKKTGVDHSHFVTHQPLDPKIFVNNLNLQSSAFRHSIRVCIACILGYLLIKILHYGNHSYWVLMTIAFMLKPAFSLTKQRNIERIVGTLIGGLFGIGVLLLIHDKHVLFVMMVVLMIGTYSFMRINYLAMVLFTTPYILILFSFLGAEYRFVAGERLLDTVIGCAIAFTTSYLLFPRWEAEHLKPYMQEIVKANAMYLHKIVQALSGQQISTLEYKLARKEVYLHSANLSAAFDRMLSEPKSKQSSQSQVQQFVVLNHILFSNIANIATSLLSHETKPYPVELFQLAKKSFCKLQESLRKFGEADLVKLPEEPVNAMSSASADDALIREQLNFIYTISKDIDKITTALLKEPNQG
ncbi:FUSC family protein [Flavisolibacter nicotianae]|uniref:FUSC family protein n=1 Tax=Flavisolibacter nicotianae TaxID=2364882 RepID=UPI000EB3648F|nr:FUSC family membrane protein [Flavisolibacter nicotianae]